ncbi:MAG: Na-translocating system protein MpsC family protein [Clostridia bacterium]|jgi:hypothetical protein|nr:Na-translocating system protein MpsC family protein [Clostridia bacterium]
MQLGDFKQAFMKINNKVNMEVFGQGLVSQRLEIFNDKVLVIGHNKRAKVISTIERKDSITSKLIDIALIVEYKELFIKYMQEELGVKVLTHLKDYDGDSELSFSVTFLEKPVEELLKEL